MRPLGRVDDDRVGRVPERGRYLDLGDVVLGSRAGAKSPPRWSRVSVSFVPPAPAIEIETCSTSSPRAQATGVAPKWMAPLTTSVA